MFLKHLRMNFLSGYFHIPGWIITPFCLWTVYYLSTNIIYVLSPNPKDLKNRTGLVLLIQLFFVSLVPMFTILSCDYWRVVSYWIMGAYIAYFSIIEKQINDLVPQSFKTLSLKIDKVLQFGIPHNKYVIYLFLFFTGVSPYTANIQWIFDSSIFGNIIKNIDVLFIF